MPHGRTLEQVRINNPCPVSWASMKGDERVRFCGQCGLNVYNLSAMSRQEAEAFLASVEGRTCLRLFRRHDGRVLTQDCPAGRKARRRRLVALAALFLAGFVAGLALLLSCFGDKQTQGRRRFTELRRHEPFRTVLEWLDPSPPPQFDLKLGNWLSGF